MTVMAVEQSGWNRVDNFRHRVFDFVRSRRILAVCKRRTSFLAVRRANGFDLVMEFINARCDLGLSHFLEAESSLLQTET